MFVKIILLVLFITVVCSLADEYDIGQKSCCPLVWKTLINTPYGVFVPKDAIVVGTARGNVKHYFSMKPAGEQKSYENGILTSSWNLTSNRIAYFSDAGGFTDEAKCLFWEYYGKPFCFWRYDDNNKRKRPRSVKVLSNPFNCDISWRTIDDAKFIQWQSSDIHTPFVSESNPQYFARMMTLYGYKAGAISNGTAFTTVHYYGNNWGYGKESATGKEVLQINCSSSVRKLFVAELYDIKFNLSAIKGREESVRVKQLSNETPNEIQTELSISKVFTKRLQLTTEYGSTRTRELNVAISTSAEYSVGFVSEFRAQAGMDISTNNKWESFVKTGTMDVEESTETFGVKHTIKIPPRRMVVASLVTTPIKGTVPFTGYCRFKWPNNAEHNFTEEFVRATLHRISASEGSRIRKNEAGELVLVINGLIHVETGSQMQVIVKEIVIVGRGEKVTCSGDCVTRTYTIPATRIKN
jgi:hypothetical protein